MLKYDNLHREITAAIADIRTALGDAGLSEFHLTIEASGRTIDGKPKLSYALTSYKYDNEGRAEGRSLDAVIAECVRRAGWNKRNAPLELSDQREVDSENY